jgi:hypothetical protein
VFHGDLSDASGSNGEIQCVLDIAMGHSCRQFPSEDIAREVIQDRGKIVVSPARDFELGEVGLPQFIHTPRRMRKFIAGFEQDKRWTRNEVKAFENTIHTRLGDEIPLMVSDVLG